MATGQCPRCGNSMYLFLHLEATSTSQEFKMWRCDTFWCRGTRKEYNGMPFTKRKKKEPHPGQRELF